MSSSFPFLNFLLFIFYFFVILWFSSEDPILKINSNLTTALAREDQGEQGWRSGESARLPPMWPGFKSRRQRHMWVEFVVGSLLSFQRFFSGYSGFPLSSKPNISQFQFDQESRRRRATLWMCYLQIIIIYLFIYLFIYLLATNAKTAPKVSLVGSLQYSALFAFR